MLVGAGGFIGATLRFLVGRLVPFSLGSFPWATFAVNVVGCLLVGVAYGIADRAGVFSEEMRLFLAVGFCGGFTTFSTFGNETLQMFQNGQFAMPIVYIALSVVLGITAVLAGRYVVGVF